MDEVQTFGEKVAFHRRRRGLSQVELARLLRRSESWVSQVERGVRQVDRRSVLERLADTLEVSVGDLTGEVIGTRHALDESTNTLEELRLTLSGHPVLGALLGPKPQDVSVANLSADVTRAWELVHASSYEELGGLLSRLVVDLETVVRAAPPRQRRRLLELLAEAYQVVAALFAKVADIDASWVASDRALMTAEQLGNPLAVLASQFRMAHTFLAGGRLDQARHSATTAIAGLKRSAGPAQRDELPALSLLGAFELVLAIVSAREGERSAAYLHLDRARGLADRIGSGRDDFGTEFGPDNVSMHEVSVAVELGDAGRALDVAADLDLSGLSPERCSRFLIDIARAHAQRRRPQETLTALLEAEKFGPEQVRDHPLVRQLVRDDLQRAGRRPPPELRDLARRIGIVP